MQGILRHTDYALRVVFHLAALGAGARVQVKDIAERRLMPAPFVRRVVARLAANGILSTVRGSGGGVRLARPADAISLLDVVRAMEGGIVLNRCVVDRPACPLAETCPVQRAWCEATRLLEEHLGSVAFADLLKPPKAGKET
jgi:Rrf2 family protein